jgi:hypothetical protein
MVIGVGGEKSPLGLLVVLGCLQMAVLKRLSFDNGNDDRDCAIRLHAGFIGAGIREKDE